MNTAKDEAVFAAENALNNTAKILGGFMACSDIKTPAKLLLDVHEANVKLVQLKEEKTQLTLKVEAAKANGKDASKFEQNLAQV